MDTWVFLLAGRPGRRRMSAQFYTLNLGAALLAGLLLLTTAGL